MTVGEVVSMTGGPGEMRYAKYIGGNFSMKALLSAVRAFAREEDGVALTEYLILLGILIGGVVATVQIAGTNLNTAWTGWSTWWTATVPAP